MHEASGILSTAHLLFSLTAPRRFHVGAGDVRQILGLITSEHTCGSNLQLHCTDLPKTAPQQVANYHM
jgi:hypothetical protein